MGKRINYCWGIWLPGERRWASLPDRMRKPSPYNCDLNRGLIDVMHELIRKGLACELKRIPDRELKAMRFEHESK